MTCKQHKLGIILAAGLGERLCKYGDKGTIKPLSLINDLSLLLRTIYSHEVAGRDFIVIVVGWQSDVIKKSILSEYNGSIELKFVYNEQYRLKNGISVISARPYVEEEFILTMADHILDRSIMELASRQHAPLGGASLCVDYKLDTIFDMGDATKVLEEDGFIRKIGKDIAPYNCVDTGVFIGTVGLIEAIDRVYQKKGDASLSEGVQALADAGQMKAVDIKGGYWQDVDTPEMLEHAEKLLKWRICNGN